MQILSLKRNKNPHDFQKKDLMCTLQNTQKNVTKHRATVVYSNADFLPFFKNRIIFLYWGCELGSPVLKKKKKHHPRSDFFAPRQHVYSEYESCVTMKQPEDTWMNHCFYLNNFFFTAKRNSVQLNQLCNSNSELEACCYCRLWIISSLAMRCVVLLTRDMRELSLCDQSFSRSLGSLGLWKLMMPASRSTLA